MNFLQQIDKLLNLGVPSEASFLTKQEIRLVNGITFFGAVIIFGYGFLNIIHFPLIGIMNFLIASLMMNAIRLNGKGKPKQAQIWLMVSLGFLLIMVNFISPNTTEYYLICLMAISLLMVRGLIIRIVMATIVSASILIPKTVPYTFSMMEDVGKDRIFINAAIGIILLVVLIVYIQGIQKKYQQQIEDQSKQISELNFDLKHLFAIIAHDIHSPLQASTMMLDEITHSNVPSETREQSIQLVHKQLVTLQRNLNNLLDWSRHNMQGLQTVPEVIQLAEMVKTTVEAMDERFREKEIWVDVEIASDIHIFADPVHISVIFRNLLDNALKFSNPKGQVNIRANEENKLTNISIEDQGIGMDKILMDSIFHKIKDPAFGTSGERGTGLGLVLVEKLVRANQGSVRINSSQDKGTTIWIDLPNS